MSASPKVSRPHIPGYGIPKTKKGMVAWAWVEEQLTQAKNYWVGTLHPDGRPHNIPLWGCWLDGSFYFSSGDQTRHIRNLTLNPAIGIHLESGDNVVIVEAVAAKATSLDAGLLVQIAEAMHNKYGMSHSEEGLWMAIPHTVFAWKDGFHSATRFEFEPSS
jgi:hypothetical protein